jgi:hypothetical protein
VIAGALAIYAFISPVVYAILAGRAKMNLIDEDAWHRHAFRAFMVPLVVLLIAWLLSVGLTDFSCKK